MGEASLNVPPVCVEGVDTITKQKAVRKGTSPDPHSFFAVCFSRDHFLRSCRRSFLMFQSFWDRST